MRSGGGLAAVAILLALALSPSHAASRTDATIKNRAIDAVLTIDPKLSAFPDLRATLLEDGKRVMKATVDDAAADRREAAGQFRRWSFSRAYELRNAVGPFVSVLTVDSIYSGGAHPNTDLSSLLWDRAASRAVGLDALLIDTASGGQTLAALARTIRRSLAAARKAKSADITSGEAGDPDTDFAVVEARLDTLGAPTLAPSSQAGKASGITFHFPPYAVGSYAEGIYVAFVPAADLAPFLKPAVANLFGGARPDKDE